MKTAKKALMVCGIAALILVTALCGAFLYLYHDSPAIKSFFEKSISRSIGVPVNIKYLSYSLNPLSFQAKGIHSESREPEKQSDFELSELSADMALEGPFGHKTLVFRSLKVDGFSFRAFQEIPPLRIGAPETGLSFISQMVTRLIGFFLFRDIRIQSVDVLNGDIAAQWENQRIQITGIHASLDTAGSVKISFSAKFEMPLHEVILNAPEVDILTAHAISFTNPEITFLLTARKARLQSPAMDAGSLDVTAKFTYDHKFKTIKLEPVEVHSERIQLKMESEQKPNPLKLQLRTEGLFNLQDNSLNALSFNLRVGDMAELSGELNALFGPQMRIRIKHLDSQVLPQKIISSLPERVRTNLGPLDLSGPIRVVGAVESLKENQKWQSQLDLQVRLEENGFSYKKEKYALDGKVTGYVAAKGRFPDLKLAAELKGDMGRVSARTMELNPFQATLSIAGKHPVYRIGDFTTRIPQLKLVAGKKEIQVKDIRIRARKGILDAEKKSLFLPEVQVDSSLLKNATLSLNLNQKQAVIDFVGNNLNLLGSAQSLGLLPTGWQFRALESLELKVILKEKKDCSFTAKLAVQDLGFESPDANSMGEGVSIHAEMKGKTDLSTEYVAIDTHIQINQGEILYDRFYINLKENSFLSTFKGSYQVSRRSLEVSSLKAGLKNILALQADGTLVHKIKDRRCRLTINIPPTPLKPVFRHLILEPFRTAKPFLSNLSLGGIISGDLEVSGSGESWTAVGKCFWHEGELSSADNDVSFRGVRLSLPLWYQAREVSKRRKKVEKVKGALSINAMTLPLLPKQPLRIELQAGPNSLSVNSPTSFSIPGGKVKIGPIVCSNIFGSRPVIESSLFFPDIEINPFLSKIWSNPTEGTVNGKLDPIILEGDALTTRGKITAKIFDGEVILTDLHASGMFSSAPIFGLNARWNALNLAKLTTGTAFGRIEGILDGHITNLEIAYGQPQKFDLLLETVKKRGIAQRISVMAVENIAEIGGGQSPFVGLAGGVALFFKKFPYQKIGVRATLENDEFRVNGTIREGGYEYLVKRGSFSGVNVVNQNPDNRISFKDMVKRIKRITVKGSGAPVIK